MENILEISRLKVYYNTALGYVRAVDDVDLAIKKGEIFGIAGESGCGKSTLAKAILRLHSPSVYINGKVLFEGINLLTLDENKMRKIRGRRIGYIPQSAMNSLNPIMRIKDQIVDAMEDHGLIKKNERKNIDSKIGELFEEIGLQKRWINAYPHELSGGMKQRAIIACVLSLQPDVVIADEPTTALDVVVQRGIIELLRNLRDKMNITLIIITHDMGVQAMLCDKIAIMYGGKIMEIAKVSECFNDPLHPYTKMLISAIPKLGVKEKLKFLSGSPPDLRNPPKGCRFYPRCPVAMEICKKKEPILEMVEPGRFISCHLYGKGANS